jgi:hypothetical protein
MNGPITKLSFLLLVSVIFGLCSCAGGNYGKLAKTDKFSEKELRQNWRNYRVYYNRGAALLYKMNDDRKILLSSSWIEVTGEDMMAKSSIFNTTRTLKISGQNDEVYGYLVLDNDDMANVKIIDDCTIRLYYHRTRKGGP